MWEGSQHTRAGWVVVWVALLTALLLHGAHYSFICDDAFISFRYARNLLDGHGLVFNPGERVEGYTNFLWVLEVAAVWGLSGLEPFYAALNLSWLATLATCAVVVASGLESHHRGHRQAAVALALALLACNRSFAVWCTSGLETRQFTLFVFAALALIRHPTPRRLRAASLLLGLAQLTRPEAPLVWACAAAWLALDGLRRGESLRRLTGFAAPFLAVLAFHLAFRVGYYHDLLPNTWYAKSGAYWWDLGLRMLLTAALEQGLIVLAPLALAGAVSRWGTDRDTSHALLAVVGVPWLSYVVLNGGDHFEYRTLDFLWPLLALAAADGIVALGSAAAQRAGRAAGLAVAGAATGLALVYSTALPWLDHLNMRDLDPDARTYTSLHMDLDPHRAAWVGRLPLVPWMAEIWNHQRRSCVRRWVGSRHLEHAAFAKQQLRRWAGYQHMIGKMPAGLTTAMGAVGIAPFYLADVEVIDRFGLTDARVSRLPTRDGALSAHMRQAPDRYLHRRGVNTEFMPIAPTREAALADAAVAVRLRESLWMPLTTTREAAALFPRRQLYASVFLGPDHPQDVPVVIDGRAFFVEERLWGFEHRRARGWTTEGSAFHDQPAEHEPRHLLQGVGTGRVDSRHPAGRAATGSMRSRPFVAQPGQVLVFLLGGGEGPDVGASIHDATGTLATWHGTGQDRTRFITWDAGSRAGTELWVEIFDADPGDHVIADHFVLMRAAP